MSGGHWEHYGLQMQDMLEDIGNDDVVKTRFPRLSNILIRLGKVLCDIEHELDWDISGDSKIKDDSKFETDSINTLRNIISVRAEIQDLNDDIHNLHDEIEKLENRLKNLKV